MMSKDNPLLRAALAYASLGWPVFPVKAGLKVPRIEGWPEAATTEPATIAAWWKQHPNDNIGILTGRRSGVGVVDIDPRHGGDYFDFTLENDAEDCPLVKTPSGGYHLYFSLPPEGEFPKRPAGPLGPGIDFQGERAFVVAPPSIIRRKDGREAQYGWDARPALPGHDGGITPPPLPVAVIAKLREKPEAQAGAPPLAETIPTGQRNSTMASLAGTMRRRGAGEAAILATLQVENDSRCVPPLAAEELLTIARSVARYQPAPGNGSGGEETRLQLVSRLAALSPIEYDLARRVEAERLGVSLSALDREVSERRRALQADKSVGGSPAEPQEAEPWPETVEGAALLDALAARFAHHVILPEHAAAALALWTLHTHCFEAADVSPLLLLTSPEKRCGKTTVLSLLTRLTCKPMPVSNTTAAALFRSVESWRPTLLIDEADSFMAEQEELRGIVNSGHTRSTAFVLRVEGEKHELRRFSTWCPKAIASIGRQAATIHDRSIVIKMRRRRPDETVSKLRGRTDAAEFLALARQCARWAADNLDGLSQAESAAPEGLDDRQADNWEPLISLADAAGGEWPAKARAAALALSGVTEADEGDSTRILLLADIREVFAGILADRITTEALIDQLKQLAEHPWPTYDRGKSITPRQLAKLLNSFEIKSRTIRLPDSTAKGYHRVDFADSFERYLENPAGAGINPSHPLHDSQQKTSGLLVAVTGEDMLRMENEGNPFKNNNVTDDDDNGGGEYEERDVPAPAGRALAAHYFECNDANGTKMSKSSVSDRLARLCGPRSRNEMD